MQQCQGFIRNRDFPLLTLSTSLTIGSGVGWSPLGLVVFGVAFVVFWSRERSGVHMRGVEVQEWSFLGHFWSFQVNLGHFKSLKLIYISRQLRRQGHLLDRGVKVSYKEHVCAWNTLDQLVQPRLFTRVLTQVFYTKYKRPYYLGNCDFLSRCFFL